MDRSKIDKIAQTQEDRMLLSMLWDKINAGIQRNIPAHTPFLSPRELEMAKFLFGEPDGVSSRATTSVSLYDTVHTSLYYGNVPITAIGDWTLQGVPFEARAQLNFSLATLIFDGNKLTVYPKDGTDPYEAVLEKISGYESEISYFCDVVEGKISNTKNTARSAAETVRLIEHLRKSVELQGEKIEFGS